MNCKEAIRGAYDWIVANLQEVGLQRRLWRPTVKFILGGGYAGSILTAVVFSIILSITFNKKPTLKSFVVTMALLVALETVSEWADKYTSQLLSIKDIQPLETLRLLASATFLIYLEITLWTTAMTVYRN